MLSSFISFLKNEKNLPLKIRNELPVVMADYYMRRGQNTEASTRLMEATRNNNPIYGISKSKRGRYSFITAQLFEKSKDDLAPGTCSSIGTQVFLSSLSSALELTLLISTPSFWYALKERQATSCLFLSDSNRTLLIIIGFSFTLI